MQEIVATQRERAKALTGRAFLLGVAGIVLRLALAQIVCNLAIRASGVGLLNVLFYLYAVWLLVRFMRRTVAGTQIVLKTDTLVLSRMLGDSAVSVVDIPLADVVAVRPVACGERLNLCYRQVTVMDEAAVAPARVRFAFTCSLFSARLARLVAGDRAQQQAGWVIVYRVGKELTLRACVFRPNAEMQTALAGALGDRWQRDDRMARPKLQTFRARSIARAFPALHPHVAPLVSAEDEAWAQARMEEIAQKQAARRARDAQKQKARTPNDAPAPAPDAPTAQDAPAPAPDAPKDAPNGEPTRQEPPIDQRARRRRGKREDA